MDHQPPVLGLTLKYFHRLVDIHGGRDCFQGLTTLDVCLRFVKPYTATSQLSLVDHVLSQPRGHEYAKPAQWLISHSWSYQFLDVVDAIDGFCHEQELSPDTSFWFCMFANNQHAIGEPSIMFEHFLQAFRTALEFTGQLVMVLSPWHDPATLKRTWCVYEVYLSIVLNARFEVAMGTTQKLEFLSDIKEPESVLRMLGQINSSNSITTEPSDRDRIFELIEDQVGFVKLDRLVFDVLQGWIMRTLDKQIELAATAEEKFEWEFTKAEKKADEEEYDEARSGFQTAVDIFKRDLSPSFWRGWEAQLHIGTSYAKQLYARETWEPICDEALSKLRGLVGRDHPVLFRAVVEVGDARAYCGDIDRGTPLLEEALKLAEAFHGVREILDSKHRLGIYLNRQDRPQEAEAMLRVAYDGFCEMYGAVHKRTTTCRSNLAACYVGLGRYREAEALMALNFKVQLRTRGEMQPDVLITMFNLGAVQRLMGKYEEAEKNLQKSLEGFQREGNLANALSARRLLGFLKFCRGDLVCAKTWIESVHEANLKTLAPSHPSCQNFVLQRYLVSFEIRTEFDLIGQIEAFQQLLEAANIEDETWTKFNCDKCYEPIDGDMAICAQCPRHSIRFCQGCLGAPALHLICGHHDGPWHVIPHPTRYLRERKALLLAKPQLPENHEEVKYVWTRVPRAVLRLRTAIAGAIVRWLPRTTPK